MNTSAVSILSSKLAASAILAVAAVIPAQAQTVVTDTWSSPGGAWIAASDALAGENPAINSASWTNAATWQSAGLTPHAFSFVSDAGSTGGAVLSTAGQTTFPSFSQAASYYFTASSTPTFTVTDTSALTGLDTISLTVIARYTGGGLAAADNVFQLTASPLVYINGASTGLSAASQVIAPSTVQRPGSSAFYNYVTYTWDLSALSVDSFAIEMAAKASNQIHSFSVTQTAAAVPEPAAFAGLAGAIVFAGVMLRRRRRA